MKDKDKKIVTDMPNIVGWIDGLNAIRNNGRKSRADQMPDDQKQFYKDGFRKGARDGSKY